MPRPTCMTPADRKQIREDPVLAAAETILSFQNAKNRILCHASLPLNVEAIPYTTTDPKNGNYYQLSRSSLLENYPEYVKGDGKWETIVRMRLSGDAVEVQAADSWLPLAEFLTTLPSVTDYWAGPGSAYWRQSLEWSTNGKTFPLMQLPGELRNRIYDYVASFSYPYEFDNGFNYVAASGTDGLLYREYGRSGSHLRAELFGRGRVLNGAGPVLPLLLSSKKVNAEFSHRLWRSAEFRFQGVHTLRRFFECRPSFHGLSKVCLQMTTWVFVKFFGVWVQQSAQPWSPPDATILRGLPLRELELRLGHRENFTGYRLDTWLAPCCHKVLTGLILWAAKDHIKDIPLVTVEGCVSREAKAAFLQLLDDERSGVESSVTEWDVIGHSAELVRKGKSWLARTDTDLGCSLLDHRHRCDEMGHCTDDFCLSENDFSLPRSVVAVSKTAG